MIKSNLGIVATIGPASESLQKIEELSEQGVTIFRFNLKHNEPSWHKEIAKRVHSVREKTGRKIEILADLQGPEMRIGEVKPEKIVLEEGKEIVFTSDKDMFSSSKEAIMLDQKYIDHLEKNSKIKIDDKMFEFTVKGKEKNSVKAVCLSKSGDFTSKKTIFFPGLEIPMSSLTPKDIENISVAEEIKSDYVALSFVRSKEDLIELKKEVFKIPNFNPKIITKFETDLALKNIDEVIDNSDVIMVARGDLAVEIGIWKVPLIQKLLIKKSQKAGKQTIVATQMIKSMTDYAVPTRAEISDVANAVLDGADFVMMSEETSVGEYPVEASSYMRKTIDYTIENHSILDE